MFLVSIGLLLASQIGLYGFLDSWWVVVVCMILYFTGFTVLEASLPALVSRLAPSDLKGTEFGILSVFGVCAGLCVLWLLVSAGMRNPLPLSTHLLNLGEVSEQASDELTAKLLSVTGVAEAVVVAEDGIAYLKVDRKRLDREALRAFSVTRA